MAKINLEQLVDKRIRHILKEDKWIGKMFKNAEKKGTEGRCSGDKFGSESCPEGSKEYAAARTLKTIAKEKSKTESLDKLNEYINGKVKLMVEKQLGGKMKECADNVIKQLDETITYKKSLKTLEESQQSLVSIQEMATNAKSTITTFFESMKK